jgi:Holliday junction resolvase RusA-like endonuclease
VTFPELLRVRVVGFPIAQARARARIWQDGERQRVSMYDPATSRDWKRTVAAQVVAAAGSWAMVASDVPIAIELAFTLPRPTSLPKRVRHHTKRPDVDNLAKAVKDALRGIIYRDDAQVGRLVVTKEYGVTPGVTIVVKHRLDEDLEHFHATPAQATLAP